MAMTTITISGSTIGEKTIMGPTSINAYGNPILTRHVPIDGATILDISANRDSYGDKNAPRRMRWDAITTTGAEWGMSLVELKALEGTDAELNATGCTAYTATQTIRVEAVNANFIGSDGVDDIWRVELIYSHV